ncbi:MAG: hypothetical protein PVSMB4_02600 [Ktedonobacterales bacterium]
MNRIRGVFGTSRVRRIAGALGLLLVGGVLGAAVVVAGPVFAANQSSGARTSVTATGPAKYCQIYEQTLESKLNVSQQQLESANQAAINAALAQAVKDGKITQNQANMIQQKVAAHGTNVCANLARLAGGHRGDHGSRDFGPALKQARQAVVNAVATKLNLAPDTLRADITGGQSIVTLAGQHGVNQSTLNATILAAVKTQADAAVKNGQLTSEQESQALTFITAQINAGHYGIVGLGPMGLGR